MALPRVHGVDVVDLVVPGHLDVPGHGDVVKARGIKALLVKGCGPGRGVHRVAKLPQTVEGLPQRIAPLLYAFIAGIVHMIAVRFDLAHAVDARIIEPLDIWLHICSFRAPRAGKNIPSVSMITRAQREVKSVVLPRVSRFLRKLY